MRKLFLVDIFDIHGWSHAEDRVFYNEKKAHDYCVGLHKKDKNLVASFREVMIMDESRAPPDAVVEAVLTKYTEWDGHSAWRHKECGSGEISDIDKYCKECGLKINWGKTKAALRQKGE